MGKLIAALIKYLISHPEVISEVANATVAVKDAIDKSKAAK